MLSCPYFVFLVTFIFLLFRARPFWCQYDNQDNFTRDRRVQWFRITNRYIVLVLNVICSFPGSWKAFLNPLESRFYWSPNQFWDTNSIRFIHSFSIQSVYCHTNYMNVTSVNMTWFQIQTHDKTVYEIMYANSEVYHIVHISIAQAKLLLMSFKGIYVITTGINIIGWQGSWKPTGCMHSIYDIQFKWLKCGKGFVN